MLRVIIFLFLCHLLSPITPQIKGNEGRQFHLFNDKRHNFKYISNACAEGIPQSFENEGHLHP